MTKARARERAKNKASRKPKSQGIDATRNEQANRPGQFDPGTQSIKGPGMRAGGNSFGGAKRGSARSK